jgi:hypothetical protein
VAGHWVNTNGWQRSLVLFLTSPFWNSFPRWLGRSDASDENHSLHQFPGPGNLCCLFTDGKQIAFSWEVEIGSHHDIYVKLVGAGEPLRLTSNPGDDIYPS